MKRSKRVLPAVTAAGMILAGLAVGCGGSDSGTGDAGGDSGADFSSGVIDTTGRWQAVVARVGDLEITVADVQDHVNRTVSEERARATLQNPDMLQVALASLLDQFVWAEKARREGFELTRSEEMRIRSLESELLATRYLGDVVQVKAYPDDEEARAYYEDNQEEFLLPVKVASAHILVDSEGAARALLEQLRNGADFRALAKEHSRDPLTRDIGGNQGWITSGREILGVGHSHQFEQAVYRLDPGEYGIVQLQDGWHVVTCLKREGGGIASFEEARDAINNRLVRNKFATVYNDELAKAREELDAGFVPAGFEKFTGVTQNVARLFEMAGQAPDPGQRVELYRRVVFDYPDSEQAPEAQFMIAYINIKWLDDHDAAKKSLARLARRYPDTEWGRAGSYIGENYLDEEKAGRPSHGHAHDEDGESSPEMRLPESPEEILEKVR